MAFAEINWLDLVNALDQKLVANLPGLLTEINALYPTDALASPVAIEKGISVELLERTPDELPALASFIYERVPVRDGENNWAIVSYPYIIEVYLAGPSKDSLNIQAVKWAMVLCEFVKRHMDGIMFGVSTHNFPKADTTYVLRKRGTYKQLVTVSGYLKVAEE